MSAPAYVTRVDLSAPVPSFHGLHGYASLHVLVCLGLQPVGRVDVPLAAGTCAAETLAGAIAADTTIIWRDHLPDGTPPPTDSQLQHEGLVGAAAHRLTTTGTQPLVTVAVCTRDRPDALAACLAALQRLRYPAVDLLVVDNAPSSDATERLVRTRFPSVRYVREPRPGLNNARNRALAEARGSIVAYTDDDVRVDPLWVTALVGAFADTPEAMAVCGLVVPEALDTPAQQLFESYGGFERGYKRRRYALRFFGETPPRIYHHNAGRFGTGANMAFRAEVFDHVGGFDPALDVGTPTQGGGDLEMYFRIIQEGHTLVYEPRALVWHQHRATLEALQRQLTTWGTGFWSFAFRSLAAYPGQWKSFAAIVPWWLRHRVSRWLQAWRAGDAVQQQLVACEVRGALKSGIVYWRSRRHAAEWAPRVARPQARHEAAVDLASAA
ncbi:glycosyltransferase family 2 protein [Salisaeta longa]|uniref:glycosyltransferase family 2 protein n=1 Tax=Salisaeta longa TaxID=503170 RepID=UPI0003B47EA2|nr:glycosyltransferase [Salisaeta longa]